MQDGGPSCRVCHEGSQVSKSLGAAAVSDRKKNAPKGSEATLVAGDVTGAENTPFSLGNTASLEAKPGVSKSESKPLEWQEVNSATWRLIDSDGPMLLQPACHGFWGGYQYPKALAYVFDVGVDRPDW